MQRLDGQLSQHKQMQEYCRQLHHRVEELEQLERTLAQAVQEAERRYQTRYHGRQCSASTFKTK